ncbi:MAG: polyprenyl synthetase family protein, partial [Candidatus Omnitrophica bacterium]|nr:polyprenyl synthetase family protein [Candidatus Omnitrophota bacterium]
MILKIKSKIDKEISAFLKDTDKRYHLKKISPVLYKNICEFANRDGKRARPILFVIGYLGFSNKEATGLYRSAISIELMHDFMLVHDDIIDKSDTRRGRP